MSVPTVMIMAGGTGGHVFPGLAVAEVLRARQHGVVWLGTRQGLEARVVPEHGIEIHWISIAGVRGRGLIAWLVAPFKIAAGVWQALGALRRCRPAVVLGMGGFVAGPGGIAAWLTRRPLLIHEQNSIAGTTNRLLARFASRVFEAFPGTFPAATRAVTVGNPVRRDIARLASREDRPRGDRRLNLLVLGGSQGALALNRAVPVALAALDPGARPLVRHQAGRTLAEARAAYAEAGVDAELHPFIDDIAASYAWADLVIARAGALTIAELALAGVGAILVPYPYATDAHQDSNAAYFADEGAGIVVAESELDAGGLEAALRHCLAAPDAIESMSRAARRLALPDAAERVADGCVELAEARR
jgi:UDP-N-acetylglucosamine--N-acetylmuramyl-(pentapeptide) pyrophosphoryl-undecaprenol N-acetylglucosamine transferase